MTGVLLDSSTLGRLDEPAEKLAKYDSRDPGGTSAAVKLTGATPPSLRGRRNCPARPCSLREGYELSSRN